MNNSYVYEVQFYLSLILYDRYLKNDNVLLDMYINTIKDICKDYIKYDNSKKPLIESVNDYIEKRKDFILENLNECIDY